MLALHRPPAERPFLAIILAAAIVACASNRVQAQVIAAEVFNYPAGSSLNGLNGDVGWAGAWATSPVYTGNGQDNAIAVGSMSFPGITPAGNRLGTLGNDVRSFRPIDCSPGSAAAAAGLVNANGKIGLPGTTVWLGFLAALSPGANTNTGNGGFHLFDGIGNLTTNPDGDKVNHEVAFFGDRNNPTTGLNWCLEMTSGGTGSMDSTTVVNNVTRLLVYKIEFLGGRNGRVSMFVDPSPGADPTTLTPAFVTNVVSSSTVQSTFQFNYLEVGSASGTPIERLDLDEFRIGVSYASAVGVPEPSSMLLLASVGGWAFLRRQRGGCRVNYVRP